MISRGTESVRRAYRQVDFSVEKRPKVIRISAYDSSDIVKLPGLGYSSVNGTGIAVE